MNRILPSVFLFALFFGCQSEKEWVRNVSAGPALGTSYSIIYLTKEPLDLQRKVDSVFFVINQSMSTYITDSDISKINNGDSSIIVDQMFREVFELSKEVYEDTEGYFDPTVGVLVDAWGFGPGNQIELDSVKIDSLLGYVGFDKVKITEENRHCKKQS